MARIALISPYTLPFLCGNSFLAERLRETLERRGHKVRLYNPSSHSPKQAAAFKPNLLHSLNAERPHLWVKDFLARVPVPWIVTLTGTDYNSWCGVEDPPAHVRESLDKADLLVVFHREARESLQKALPSISKRIEIVPQGVTSMTGREERLTLREERGFNPREVIFLMASSVRPIKNLAFPVEAFFRIQKEVSRVRLILAGPVMDRKEADRVLGLGKGLECFTYLGERFPLEARRLMRASDVFLNTSINEGMPGAVLEAMAEGVPVLASDVTGNRSLILHEENGLLFPLGSQDAMVEAAVRLARDPLLRKRLSKAGQEIAKVYSVEREVDRYEQLYARLLDANYKGR